LIVERDFLLELLLPSYTYRKNEKEEEVDDPEKEER